MEGVGVAEGGTPLTSANVGDWLGGSACGNEAAGVTVRLVMGAGYLCFHFVHTTVSVPF